MQKPCGDSRPRLSRGAKLRYGAQRGEAVDVGKKPEACTNYVGTAAPGCPAEQSSAEFMVVVNKLGGPAATKKNSDLIPEWEFEQAAAGELRSPGQPGAAVPT